MLLEVEQALRLQEFDKRLAELEKEISTLPKQIAQIEQLLESHNRRLKADRAALDANQKERKLKESDVQAQQQKTSKLNGQMLEAKNNEQYTAFKHEIEFSEKEVSTLEERILALMSDAEPLSAAVGAAETLLAAERAAVETEKAKARERTAADQKEMAELRARRAELTASMPPRIVADCARLLKKHPRGPVVSDATKGKCTACNMQLRPQVFQDLKRATAVMYCESCGRILLYDPPVAVEAQFDGGTRVAMS